MQRELKEKTILVTGGTGFLGGWVYQKLLEHGADKNRCFAHGLTRGDIKADLTNWHNCRMIILQTRPDIIIHAAGEVGGIGRNRREPGSMFYNNLQMGVQLMEAARQAKKEGSCRMEKFVVIGTVCAYPKHTNVPFQEKDLWQGYPEETNAPYGIAKKALLVQAQAYRQQYDFNAIYLLPVNLYGPGDSFNQQNSHVIPALIRQVAEAQRHNHDHIDVWGTGKASREFLYAEDAAEAIVLATERYDGAEPVNIGSGQEIKIRELVELICKIMDFDGKIRWDTHQPDGQPRRRLDVSRAKQYFGFQAKTNFEDGLRETIDWYLK